MKEMDQLKKLHSRMTTVVNELEILEDGVDCDYSEVIMDYRWIINQCEHRRETLQRRGRVL